MKKGLRIHAVTHALGWVMLATFLTGCGGIFGRIRGENPFPEELPQDYRERFEVRAVDIAEPVSSPGDSPSKLPPASEAGGSAKKNVKPDGLEKTIHIGTSTPLSAATAPARSAKAKPARKKSKLKVTTAPDEVVGFVYPDRRQGREFFPVGEKQLFSIYFFGMAAASVELEVLPNKEINGRRVYHIHGHAWTSRVFSLLYTVDDTIESYFDQDGLFSHRFHLKLNETKQTRDSLELLDSEKGQSYWWDRWDHKKKGYAEKKEFFPMQPLSQDSLSALYYMRTLDLKTGARHVFPIMNHGKNLNAAITVIGREVLSTELGKIPAIKVRLDAEFQGIAKKSGDSFLWLSDDSRRLLLKLEAKVKLGTITALIQEVVPPL